VLDLELAHREVPRMPGSQPRANPYGRGSYEAIGLTERDALAREVSTPSSGELALGTTERRDPQASEKGRHRSFLLGSGAAQNLLDVHCTYVGQALALAKLSQTLGGRQPSQRVDQNGRVKQQHASANASRIAFSLSSDPAGRVCVPLVPLARQRTEASFDGLPALLVLERSAHRL
jgi:hypothetical protein